MELFSTYWEGEAVSDFQRLANIKAQQLASD